MLLSAVRKEETVKFISFDRLVINPLLFPFLHFWPVWDLFSEEMILNAVYIRYKNTTTFAPKAI